MKISEIGSLEMTLGDKVINLKPCIMKGIYIVDVDKSEYEKATSKGVKFDIIEDYEDGTLKVSYPPKSCIVEVS